jgi:hypothetical protein
MSAKESGKDLYFDRIIERKTLEYTKVLAMLLKTDFYGETLISLNKVDFRFFKINRYIVLAASMTYSCIPVIYSYQKCVSYFQMCQCPTKSMVYNERKPITLFGNKV